MVPISQVINKLMQTYIKYPPRKMQSMGYDGPIELSSTRNSSRYGKKCRRRALTFRCLNRCAAAIS
ncbi:hypothetical protein PS861_04729 [Pseudomonas fluorescens]|nr:hypothetical protein PS861_04729 [Pseudomonas fluorescens]